MPMRWPWQSGVKMSTTRTPLFSAVLTRPRSSAAGGSAWIGLRIAPISSGPASSIGAPNASTTRPFHEGAGATVTGARRWSRGAPRRTSAVVANGLTVTLSASTRTISPWRRPHGSSATQSPSAAKAESPRTR